MLTHNPENERIKRRYFAYLKEAKRRGEQSEDAAAKALNRFELDTRIRSFKTFHREQAVAFKRHLAEQTSARRSRPAFFRLATMFGGSWTSGSST